MRLSEPHSILEGKSKDGCVGVPVLTNDSININGVVHVLVVININQYNIIGIIRF